MKLNRAVNAAPPEAPATAAPATASAALLVMRGVNKSFDGVPVLRDVCFDVRAGEVHALCGENGAGKTTLMNILAGIHWPDSAEIHFDGAEYAGFASAHVAQQLGIAIVFQERSLFRPLTVAENIFAGRQPAAFLGRIDRPALFAQTRSLLSEVGLQIPPDRRVEDLSSAEQQMVEIAKALSLRSKLIIFDEPTAALTESETRALFRVIAQLKERGVGLIYISHRLEEIFRIADRVTVLKDGVWQGTLPVAETNGEKLIRLMVGRDIEHRRNDAGPENNPVLLEVRKLSGPPDSHPALRDISLSVRAGEIVTLAGLAGAGRSELALTIFGARPRSSGEVLVDGKSAAISSPIAAIAAGLGYLSDDRKESGLFLEMSIAENIAAARLREFGKLWFDERAQTETANGFRARLRIASRSAAQPVATLSGGNQQKVLLARWLLVNPRILIVDEPTRGVDVGAKAEVHQLLYEFARRGSAVLVISSELPEVLTISDRILVMWQGRITGELSRAEATEEKIMKLATFSTERRANDEPTELSRLADANDEHCI
jgi:ABC-type sugar transport system ATPase subunit